MLDSRSDDESMDTQESIESVSESKSTTSSKPPETFLDPNEVVPSTYFYKKSSSRPTISELREKSKHSKHKKAPPVDETKKNMGTFTGVYLPVIVNLVGMTYWVRAGKLVGDCGVVYALLIIWVSAIISIILISSLSALGTNGEMDGGGIYFVISRSIGPELGRCLTIFLDVSTCLGAAAIVVGFAETIVSVYEPKYITGKAINDVRLLAFAIMFISIPLSFRWTQSLRITSFTHLMGLASFFIGCFMHKPYTVQGFIGQSVEKFKINAFEPRTVSKFFGYIYTVSPAFTSLTGCLSYAGNLKRPQKMIPNGLVYAFATSLLIWHVTIILLGLCGDKQFLQENTISPIIAFGINKWIGFATIIVFAMHRSLGNIGYEIGLITDMANDNLLPKIRWCYDYWMPLSITAIFIGIGSLDFSSNINTIFWLTMGVVFNWCVWSASRSHIPGWRPKSKLYSPWLSFFAS
ncbi:hypothetical protein TVAG_069070 [Trichomonas vaginalis G3]|uniref:Amino acid permease/ SLC12A domain-containing protein n=1 Tax=Trichomonas vaginalis (strain ATCC PRA-98 / G3) TaxID=412133 RepID=A2G9E8_TRIV3|nr:cation:chloride symporter protein [Trichomonas vaginalis G3]EAX86219.1 hypothetical protein TVAG_069070 [Trichomonas vaginalis G3]KAI5546331.1 cation:chloride symporter protein [Trichomonas vaginalis G3]|eukprot:XP_001299149.1 hypothetical protein [Trichomonas vaginalis G3]